ncbi:hypothetical protein AK812_SmicGene40973 [Symbiodinium microadriaticum]|uniref:Uncharacterized protein n=1 Tax=Symbiodinium microadriaticum TaxID=2951 RepID=A0A1Q9C7C2_SYMMI|nr:hypothetical protein AK812_SmicGene40973 [Symbiodinium microadriaticum]
MITGSWPPPQVQTNDTFVGSDAFCTLGHARRKEQQAPAEWVTLQCCGCRWHADRTLGHARRKEQQAPAEGGDSAVLRLSAACRPPLAAVGTLGHARRKEQQAPAEGGDSAVLRLSAACRPRNEQQADVGVAFDLIGRDAEGDQGGMTGGGRRGATVAVDVSRADHNEALARWALQGNALRQKRPQPATTCAGETPLKDGVDDVLHVLRYDCFRAEHLLPHWSGSERLQQMPYLPVALEQ